MIFLIGVMVAIIYIEVRYLSIFWSDSYTITINEHLIQLKLLQLLLVTVKIIILHCCSYNNHYKHMILLIGIQVAIICL
jgi:hypothetical protein